MKVYCRGQEAPAILTARRFRHSGVSLPRTPELDSMCRTRETQRPDLEREKGREKDLYLSVAVTIQRSPARSSVCLHLISNSAGLPWLWHTPAEPPCFVCTHRSNDYEHRRTYPREELDEAHKRSDLRR